MKRSIRRIEKLLALGSQAPAERIITAGEQYDFAQKVYRAYGGAAPKLEDFKAMTKAEWMAPFDKALREAYGTPDTQP